MNNRSGTHNIQEGKSTNSNLVLIPPHNFSYLEDALCRCTAPLSKSNLPFIQSNSITCIINISGEKLDPYIVSHFEQQGNSIKLPDGVDPSMTPISDFKLWIKTTIELILSQYNIGVTILVGSTESFLDCLVVGCLRRVQEWCYVSILEEFRQYTWPQKLFDFEQMIEIFDTDLVDTTSNRPEFIEIHQTLEKLEDKLLKRCRARKMTSIDEVNMHIPESERAEPEPKESGITNTSITVEDTILPMPIEEGRMDVDEFDSNSEEQARIDNTLLKLLFTGKNIVLSPGVKYDPMLSLINDKDDDD